ncbi:MAG: hypothetical protein OEY44_02685, partial [Candidatus Peregrinibacteria bacterium]|nr:hypothetical protein [Candidatus Peregrinibacteria bacterium]
GQSTTQFLTEVIAYFREQMLINLGSSKDTKTIVGFIDIFTQAKGQLDLSPIPELPIEVAIIKACEFEVGQAEEVQPAPIKAQVVPKPGELGSLDSKSGTQEAELDFKRIKQNWPRVLENIETPFIQMSLKDGEPSAFESEVLTITFSSGTFLEKINSSSNQEVVQKALEKVYGKRLSLNLVTKKVELSLEKKKVEKKEEEGASIVEMAQEVFGLNSK